MSSCWRTNSAQQWCTDWMVFSFAFSLHHPVFSSTLKKRKENETLISTILSLSHTHTQKSSLNNKTNTTHYRTHSVTHTWESQEWENICSIWISTIKEKEKKTGEGRGAMFLTGLLWISCVKCVQEGVFSQLAVSISHLTDTELNELWWAQKLLMLKSHFN